MGKETDRVYLDRELASLYYKQKKYEKASAKIKEVITYFVNPNILYQKIENTLGFKSKGISEIVYLGGQQNIGCVTTTDKGKEFITKLAIGKNREYHFYHFIYPLYLNLYKKEAKSISPFIQQFHLPDKNITAILMNRINGIPINLSSELEEVFQINRMYSAIKYKNIQDSWKLDELDSEFILFHPTQPKNPITALHSFSAIHKKKVNESLFLQVKQHLKEKNYNDSVEYFNELEKLILANGVYDKIILAKNFSIQHGDFFEHNILKEGETLYCIDWGCARLSPVATDIAGLLGRLKLPYQFIKAEYLNHSRSNHLSSLDKIIFIYILIITWLIIYEKQELDQNAAIDLRAAISDIRNRLKTGQVI